MFSQELFSWLAAEKEAFIIVSWLPAFEPVALNGTKQRAKEEKKKEKKTKQSEVNLRSASTISAE